MEFFTAVLCLAAVTVLAYVAANLAAPDGEPLHGVYAVPGRWFLLKYHITKCLLRWSKYRKHNIRRRAMDYHSLQEKMKDVAEMEFFNGFEKGQNSVYINGSDQTGQARLVVRVSIKPHDQREVWFLLRLPGVGDLVLPSHPDCTVNNVRPGEGFSGAGLSCSPIKPLLTWRISFNGLCRVGIRQEWSANDDRPLVHVRCSLLWSTFTTFYDFAGDTNLGLAADNIAREKWTRQFFINLNSMYRDHYVQFGMIHGVVQVDDQEERSLLLRGVKERLIGPQHWRDIYTCISNYIVLENGNCVYANASCVPKCLTNATSGVLIKSVGDVIPASSVDLPQAVLMENANEPPKNFTFSFKPETGKRLDVKVYIEDTMYFNVGSDWCAQIGEGLCRFTINGMEGWGICQTLRRCDRGRPLPAKELVPKLYQEPGKNPVARATMALRAPMNLDVESVKDSNVLVVSLTATYCQVSALTGGKGSQLAKLVALRNQTPMEYEVPLGFCITTCAFEDHLQGNKDLQKALSELSAVSRTVRKGNLKETCDRTVALFAKTAISNRLKDKIEGIFCEIFEDTKNSKTYAVRSSAVGEDTSLTSAAGQMETFLGLNSLEKIFEAIQGCWASNFSFQAVQYRRQYGQAVDSAMAVVVQETVPAESAGVAFSRDPMTGNPSRIVINSNYGLGESVVSGTMEADTITLHVDGNKQLTVGDKKIGQKEEAIFVAEGGGTQTTRQADSRAASCSLSDEMCFRLGRIAVRLDECFSDARDIEWAAIGDTLYLLQARAITTIDVPSHYELVHEFDTGIPSDKTWLTTANIQEMCPGAVSPLTLLHFCRDCDVLDQVYSCEGLQRPMSTPAPRNIMIGYNHAFISLTNLVSMTLRMMPISNDEVGGILSGEPFDKECVRRAKKLNEPLLPMWHMYLNRLKFLLIVLFNRRKLEREFALAVTHLKKQWRTAQDQYDDICRYPSDGWQILKCHALETHKSAIFQEIIKQLIIDYTEKELIPGHIALLLSSCPDVESADVPLALEQVAKSILKEGMSESFQTMSCDDAVAWLKTPSSGEAGKAFSAFLQRHGHRCVKEAELRDKSWGMDPTQVIPSLQAILASGSYKSSEEKKVLTAAEAMDQLGLAIPALPRKILVSYIVPKAREGVSAREASKSMYIKINHHLKEAYWRLANLMVKEGRLPDEDLLFFFTPEEIGRLLKNRSPALIARALRRRRVLPEQNEHRFELIHVGRPEPISEEEDNAKTEFKLQGTPISQGIVKGAARVVTTLKDAVNIKKGEILIARITDIGWSPYFPVISGLVTEIGGVLSHGAVVAREYGIPCVVGVQRATSVFKSGDTILMNGSKGTVEKMETPLEGLPTSAAQ